MWDVLKSSFGMVRQAAKGPVAFMGMKVLICNTAISKLYGKSHWLLQNTYLGYLFSLYSVIYLLCIY